MKPIKRDISLQPFSRDHHHALLLSWKIRKGIKKDIDPVSIKKYNDWFFQEHLVPHFEVEENLLYPILGDNNEDIIKAKKEHIELKELFGQSQPDYNILQIIADKLESHIRFEERILFNEIQNAATTSQLEQINTLHKEQKFIENNNDAYWL